MAFMLSLREQENFYIHKYGKCISDVFSPEIPFIASDWQPPEIQKFQPVGTDSFDWVLCYSDEIFMHWRGMEQKRMIVKRFPNIFAFRPTLLTIVRDLVMQSNMATATLHLAIYIMDNFLSKTTMQNDKLKLVAVTCFLLAAKVEDVEFKLPPFALLNKIILNNSFTLNDYKTLEARILTSLNFNLIMPTIATFSNFFSRISVILEDFFTYQRFYEEVYAASNLPVDGNVYPYFATYDDMLKAINTLVLRLIDLSLDCVELINVLPSCKAAACIAAARFLYNIKPMWTIFLEVQTKYSEAEISPFVEMIMNIYEARIINVLTTQNNLTPDENCVPTISATLQIQLIPYQKTFVLEELTTKLDDNPI